MDLASEESWVDRIRDCIDDGGPALVFQPIFQLEPRELIGYEVLARFSEDTPNIWFKKATELGLGYELEMATACRAFDLVKDLPAGVYLAINFSPATVLHEGFSSRLLDYDISRIILELTEHDPVEDYDLLRSVIDPLRQEGANVCAPVPSSTALRLSIDDFGAGFASMRHVLSLRPNLVKLDVSMVRGIDVHSELRAMVTAMVVFGAKMGIQVIAEGVETQAELGTLLALDVYAAQGFFLGKPGPLP